MATQTQNPIPVGGTAVFGANHMPVSNTAPTSGAATTQTTKVSVPEAGSAVYDPNTGQKVGTAQFDPNTGKPLNTSPATAAPMPAGKPNAYTVQQGDSLSAIAKAQGTTVQDLLHTNPSITDPNQISAGQSLNLPGQPVQQPNKYKSAFQAAKMSGQAAPQDAGEARAAASAFIPQEQVQDPIMERLQQDPGYQNLLKSRQEYNDVKNQQQSLAQQYQSMVNAAGIPQLNTQLMNMQNVINGTEDDIRNEVTKAGGFATNSQIAALTNARNKVLIQNYNNLLETRNQQQQYVSTMMGFAEKDQANALNSIDQQMKFDQQISDYATKFVDNAKKTYQDVIDKVGYSGLAKMTGGDPYYTSLVENTLGLGQGGLAKLASQPNLDEQLKKAQIANVYSEISNRNATSATATPEAAQSWATNITNGTAKLTDVPKGLKNAVSNLLASEGGKASELKTNALSTATQLLGRIGNPGTGNSVPLGTVGLSSKFGVLPGTKGADFVNNYNTLKSLLSLDNVKYLKGQGQISDSERKLLEDAASQLSRSQSRSEFVKTLNNIIGNLQGSTSKFTTPTENDPLGLGI